MVSPMRLVPLALAVLASCVVEPEPRPDGGEDPARKLPPCAEAGVILGALGEGGELEPLAPGAELGVVLGFQGFQFVRVALRSPRELPRTVDVGALVVVPGVFEYATGFGGWNARDLGEGTWDTEELPLMMNDASLAQLVGKRASLELWTAAGDCRLTAAVEVVLVPGGTMDADGGFSGPDGG